jgi:hypothetical protein
MSNISSALHTIYDNVGFLEKYGGSLWLAIFIVLVFSMAIMYYYIYNNLQPIKSDWINQRCKPGVIPFAGLINKPDNMSAYEYTAQNFNYCIQSILENIAHVFLAPIYYLVSVITKVLSAISESIQEIRKLSNDMRNSVSNVSSEVMGKGMNVLIPVQHLVIKMKDLIGKTIGATTTSLFTLVGVYDTLRSSIGAILSIIGAILLSIGTLIIVYFAIPFGFGIPFAIPLLVMFLLISIPGIMIYIIQVMILKSMSKPNPGL